MLRKKKKNKETNKEEIGFSELLKSSKSIAQMEGSRSNDVTAATPMVRLLLSSQI